ncbi:DUF2807 domain-containing protein, partial [Limnohabitans sp.]
MKTNQLNTKHPLIAVLAAIFLFLIINKALFAQVVIGSGSVGGTALIPGSDGFILNGSKVYDRAGNVKDVIVGNGIYKTKEINFTSQIKKISIPSHINLIYNKEIFDKIFISGDENVIDNIQISIDPKGTLFTTITPGGYKFTNKVTVMFGGEINSFTLAGNDDLEITNTSIPNLNISLSGSSTVVVTKSNISTLNLTASGGAIAIIANEEPMNVIANMAGSSNAIITNIHNISGSISGSARIVTAQHSGKLNLKTSGGGKFYLPHKTNGVLKETLQKSRPCVPGVSPA